ncbi:hypothetical protein Tco_0999103, partial [Tanacetum coccineum]
MEWIFLTLSTTPYGGSIETGLKDSLCGSSVTKLELEEWLAPNVSLLLVDPTLYSLFDRQRHVHLQLMQMPITRDVKIQEEVLREVLSFLEIDCISDQSTSTTSPISSRASGKIEWLNSTCGNITSTPTPPQPCVTYSQMQLPRESVRILLPTHGLKRFDSQKLLTPLEEERINEVPSDDFMLGNLKFIPKGKTGEVFGMAVPRHLITETIQQSSYYPKYLEMVAKNTKKTPQESASKQSEHGTKRAPPKNPTLVKLTKPAPASKQNHLHPNYLSLLKENKQSNDAIQQSSYYPKYLEMVAKNTKKTPQDKPQGEGNDPSLELAKKLSLDAHQEKGEGEGVDADLERAIKLSLDPSFLPQRQAPVRGVAIRKRVAEEIQRLPNVEGKGKAIVTEEQAAHSLIDLSKKKSTMDQFILQSETEATAPKVDKEQGKVASTSVTSGVGISVHTENQAGSDPGQGHEALAGSNLKPMQEDSSPGEEHVALAGPNPEHMDEDFYATAYPKVHENLKLITDEHVILENLESSSATLSSMKNLVETDNFGDQFLNDKPTEDDQEKTNVVDETDSIIPDLSHQTNTSAPPVTT